MTNAVQVEPPSIAPMEPIAIVGIASLFPEARDTREFWDNIVRGRDCITDVPASRWNIADYYDPDPAAPDKTYCKRGGFLPDVDFDPLEFGLPPNILEVTDVSQLLALVVAKQALEDAGYLRGRPFNRERTGVILGIGGGQKLITPLTARLQYPVWEQALRSAGLPDDAVQRVVDKIKLAYIRWEENSFPGMLGNVIAGRIANRFDLGGINCVVDAACASSLSALKMAMSELHERRCDIMLTGGVDTDNSPFMYLCFSKTPAFSRQDRPRPFDSESDGIMIGEGIGMLVLKRLADAERDEDRIYAVIRGIGSSSDGRYKSIYAPREEGQMRALRRAYENAGVPPASVGLIEAHGTGTVAGDLCEVTALRGVLAGGNDRRRQIALGSVKSQIGHTKATAGAAGLIKATLALHHKVLPPTINVTTPNPQLGLDDSPLYLNGEARPWIASSEVPRRAGVSAFGFGGTNYHVVVEEYEREHRRPYRLHHTTREILLHASTPRDLIACCESLAEALATAEGDAADALLAEVEPSSPVPQAAARLGFVAESANACSELLRIALDLLKRQPDAEQWQHPRGIHFRRAGVDTQGRVVALFPGQGAQYVDMGRSLALSFPSLREAWSGMDACWTGTAAPPASEVVFPPPAFASDDQARQAEQLQRTEYAQPAIGAFSMGLFDLLRRAGFQPDFTAGHSFGELTALWAAGAIGAAEYAALAYARGKAMAPPDDPSFDPGGMLAVTGSLEAVRPELDRFPSVSVANLNAPDQLVLAGPRAAIAEAKQALEGRGFATVPLPVSAAFHSSLVAHAQGPFNEAIRACAFHTPRVPVYANATAQPYPSDPEAIRALLARHLLTPVLFQQQIEQLYAAGALLFVEVGPRNILTNLVKRILRDRPHTTVALNPSRGHDSDRQLREAVVRLRVIGVPLHRLDPYAAPPLPPAESRKRMSIRLNGNNYVSAATAAAYQAALQDGQPAPSSATPEASKEANPMSTTIPVAASLSASVGHDTGNGVAPAIGPVTPEPIASPLPRNSSASEERGRVLLALEQGMAHLQSHQHALLQLHQQFLAYQTEFLRLVLQSPRPDSPAGSDTTALCQQQTETLRVHEQFLVRQTDYAIGLLQLLQQQYAAHFALSSAPAPVQTSSTGGTATGQPVPAPIAVAPSAPAVPVPESIVPTVVSQAFATWEPAPASSVAPAYTPPDVSARAIPAAEPTVVPSAAPAFPAWQTTFPAAAPMLTPREIPSVPAPDADGSPSSFAPAVAPSPIPPPPVTPPPPAAPPVPQAPATLDEALLGRLGDALLDVVSAKTGYPLETLELDMDMESDLGIDSIKRVEILGAMQERFPDLPRPKPQDLAEMRTLKEVIQHLGRTLAAPEQTAPAAEGARPAPSPNGPPAPQPARVMHTVPHGPARLVPLPPPDEREVRPPAGWTCVITDDGTATPANLARVLAERGWQPVVLRFPTSLVAERPPLPPAVGRVALQALDEQHLAQTLATIADSYGPIGAFIHLHPRVTAVGQSAPLFSDTDTAIVKAIFLLAKHLRASLAALDGEARGSFMAVTRLDGEFGVAARADASPLGGGLFGLVKTLRHEWPTVFCRAVDLSPTLGGDEVLRILLTELDDPDMRLVEVGYGPGGRVTLAADLASLAGADR